MDKPFCAVFGNALGDASRMQLIEGILGSPFFGNSALGPEFIRTQGFSVVFRRDGLETVAARFPFLQPILDRVLFADCNAFYINPLVLVDGSEVRAHIDCRLTPENVRIIPNLVSVYYAEVPLDMRGGALVLTTGHVNERRIQPRTDDLIHFLGTTIHRVESMEHGARRISVVCEQYNLTSQTLAGFPACQVMADAPGLGRINAAATPDVSLNV